MELPIRLVDASMPPMQTVSYCYIMFLYKCELLSLDKCCCWFCLRLVIKHDLAFLLLLFLRLAFCLIDCSDNENHPLRGVYMNKENNFQQMNANGGWRIQ